MAKRLFLFIDAQNVYQDAREAFFQKNDHHINGQFDPAALGELICKRTPYGEDKQPRELKQVRVYTGSPDPRKDPKTSAAHTRQCTAWKKKGIFLCTRPLRYPPGYPEKPSQQKGVDVALAIDFVILAVEGEYDVGVIASTDTDIRPALEYVLQLEHIAAEVAAWRNCITKKLSIPDRHVWCHRLSQNDYLQVADRTDYSMKA